MKKKILLIIITILAVFLLFPFIMSIGKYEYLTNTFDFYSNNKDLFSKYALIISEDKYYIYNRITRTFNNDYATFIKNINKKYNNSPNVCDNKEFIDYQTGVRCEISDEYLDIFLWYKEDGENESDLVSINNKGQVLLYQDKKEYNFGKYYTYGIYYEVSYGNYEISQPNGNVYLIQSIDGEETWDSFEFYNRDEKRNIIIENYIDRFYINEKNAIFSSNNVVINPLTEKIVIGEEYYNGYEEEKAYAKDIYKDKYILVENGYFIEIRDINNKVLAREKTDKIFFDWRFKEIDNVLYITDFDYSENYYTFDGNKIKKLES